MTTAEACAILVNQVRLLSAARRDCVAWRLVALAAIHHAADLTRQLEMIDRRRRTYQRHMAEQRPDATIRREEVA